MSAPLDDITKNVMGRINTGQVKMRPKIFFVAGSVLTFSGLTLAFVSSAFLLSILHLSLREGGRMRAYRLETLQELFHWWIPVAATVALITGLWLLRRYEFSYKKSFLWIVLWFALAVVTASTLFVITGAHEMIVERGPMRELVKPWRVEGTGFGQQDSSRNRGIQRGGGVK